MSNLRDVLKSTTGLPFANAAIFACIADAQEAQAAEILALQEKVAALESAAAAKAAQTPVPPPAVGTGG